jgi:hypothetical protein
MGIRSDKSREQPKTWFNLFENKKRVLGLGFLFSFENTKKDVAVRLQVYLYNVQSCKVETVITQKERKDQLKVK